MKWPFKEGDKIGSIFGDGVVKWHSMKTLTIKVEDGREIQLLYDGRLHENDAHPVIWHRETGSPPKVGERPKWKPKRPTWCWVWDDEGNKYAWPALIRLEDGEYVTDTPECFMTFVRVEPCKPEEIPSWWPDEWK